MGILSDPIVVLPNLVGYAGDMETSKQKHKIAEFLMKNNIGVLATVNQNGQPHAATIYFVVDPSVNIYFITKQHTTKVENLLKNSKAALAVYEPQTQSTVQIAGEVHLVEDVSRSEDIFRKVLEITRKTSDSNIPPVSKIYGGEYQCYCLSPTSMRIAEYINLEHGKPDSIFEEISEA